MSIVDPYGQPVSSGSRHFSTAADRSDRAIPPQPLFKDDFDKLIPNVDRRTILGLSRKLYSNYGPIRGAITQKTNNVIGRAWEPKFTGEDREWGKKATDWLVKQWYGNCDVRGRAWDFKTLLWLDCAAIDRDGDFLIYLTEGASGYPLMQRIPANRIDQRWYGDVVPSGKYKGRKCSHGVVLDNLNRAIAFSILGDTQDKDTFIDAQDCIHVMDPQWHDQVRGIPAFDGAIKGAFGSMTATEREQLNQNIRSSIALIEYNDTGGPDTEDPSFVRGNAATDTCPATPSYENMAGGSIRYIRSNSGGKLEALDNNMPGDSWDRFQDRVIRMGMAYYDWPAELVWKPSEANAALVRNLQERARLSVEDRQDVIKAVAHFIVNWAIAKAIKVKILDSPKVPSDWYSWEFGMPRKFSIDPGREAQQRRADYAAGLRNRTGIIAEEGQDVNQMDDERIEEVFIREKKIAEAEARHGMKLDRRLFYMLTPNDQPAPDAQDSTEPTDPKEEKSKEEDEEE